jgi:nitrogen fixation/metabolism regulation signal transduction histidine kinase
MPKAEPQITERSGPSIRARLALMLALFALAPSLLLTFLASHRIAASLELMKSPGVTRTLDSAFRMNKTSLGKLEGALHAACLKAAEEPGLPTGGAGGDSAKVASTLSRMLDRYSVDYASLYVRKATGGWHLAGQAQTPDLGTQASGSAPEDTASAAPVSRGAPGAAGVSPPDLPRPLGPGQHYDQAGWLAEAVWTPSPGAGPGTEVGAGPSAQSGIGGSAQSSAGAQPGAGAETQTGAEPEALLVLAVYMGPQFFTQVQEVGRGIGYYGRLDVLKGVYLGTIWIWAGVLLLVVAAATLLTARWAARSLSRPLVELADGMGRVARGEEGVVVRPRGSRETRFLAGAFNSMVEQLAAYKRDLALAERAAAWQDIARVAAHEIRNPLTPIQFAIRRIRDRLKSMPEADQAPLRESLDSILGEVETLKALASSFSQFAKLPEPSPAVEDLNRLASETVDLFSGEGAARFAADLDRDLPHARVDASLVRMVLNNLLKNSIEAMPEGGTVTVRTRSERGLETPWVVLEVEDTGTGMDPATLAKATDAYFSTKARGSGLGLAVVHRIVLQHGGRMEIESSPGSGTRVTLRLPAASGRSAASDK